MINKTFFQILGLWILAIVFFDIMDTIIYHQANMIFVGEWFRVPMVYTGIFGDAWHTAKLGLLTCMFACIFIAWQAKQTMSLVQFLWYMFMFACTTVLTHWIVFHCLLIKSRK